MNKKSTLCSIGAMFFTAMAFAQHTENHIHSPLTCGTADISYEEFQAPRAFAAKMRATNKKLAEANASTIYIPIKMHLFGDDDGTKFADETAVNDMLAELNKIYGKAQNIEFFFAGTSFNKYANSTMNNRVTGTSSKEEKDFHLAHGATDAINFYVSRSLRGTGGYSFITPTIQANNMLYVVTGQLNDDKTTPHEFGHYFGLGHTFNQSNAKTATGEPDYTKRELVTRLTNEVAPRLSANCSTAGDYFCDTEADPYGATGSSVSNCVVTANLDANGDAYAPNMNNYMNYYWCRGDGYAFTPQQISKMQDSYLTMSQRTTFFTAPETAQLAPSNLSITPALYAGLLELSWTDNSDVETGYIIEIAEEGTQNFIPVGGVSANTTTYKLPSNIDASKKYVFRVKPSNSKNNYSVVSEVFELPKLCAVTGAKSCEGNGPAILINNFELTKNGTSILTNSNSACTAMVTSNYFDTHQAKVEAGDTINFKVQPKYGANGSYFPADVNLYCDWNNDGDFKDENELLSDSNRKIHTASGSFIVPENIQGGSYRLRVVLAYAGRELNSCATGGEMEDYALIIDAPVPPVTPPVPPVTPPVPPVTPPVPPVTPPVPPVTPPVPPVTPPVPPVTPPVPPVTPPVPPVTPPVPPVTPPVPPVTPPVPPVTPPVPPVTPPIPPVTPSVTPLSDVIVYPVPASTEIYIKNTYQFVSYEVYNTAGRLIRSGKLVNRTIDISELSEELYILFLINDKGKVYYTKFIKKDSI